MKKSASGVRKSMVPLRQQARRLRCLTGICTIRFRPASSRGRRGELCVCRILVPARTREVMAFKRLSRRQFAAIAGWPLVGRLLAGPSQAAAASEDGLPNRAAFSERLSLGDGDLILPDRGRRQRRRPRPVDLGPFRPHARDHRRSQQRRHRDRPLPSVQGRRSVDEGAGRKGLSFFDCLAACLPERSQSAKPEGPRFLQPAAG